jgi:hypothetical protein
MAGWAGEAAFSILKKISVVASARGLTKLVIKQ